LIYKVSLLLLHQEVSVENAENVSEKTSEICSVGRQTIVFRYTKIVIVKKDKAWM
jgi:predicted SPOUT superfamily RNA methylase MTH1